MSDQDNDIPDDKLLDMPEGDAPASSLRSNLRYQRQLVELNAELNGTAPPRMLLPWSTPHEKRRLEEKHRREQLALEQQLRTIAERQERLLQQIEQQQAEIAVRRQEIEDNAMRLRDGRLVYVDGDRFRDEKGRVLAGADEAEAARQHEYRPDASTWNDKQDIERRRDAAQKLHDKIIADRDSGQGPPSAQAARLDSYETEFAQKVQARRDAMNQKPATTADYENANYMDDYQLSSAPAFNDASGVVKTAVLKPKDGESEATAPELKKPPASPGPGSIKPI
jgi:hypothetical protein